MKTLINPNIDRSSWGAGPWDNEPDKIQWVDGATNLDCLMVRNSYGGVWCGYVGVSNSHPAFGRDYGDIDADVHGGLTFAASCADDHNPYGICHIPEDGRSADIWWLGFDCNHAFDFAPAQVARNDKLGWARMADEKYRDLQYVKAECVALAKQLAVIGGAK